MPERARRSARLALIALALACIARPAMAQVAAEPTLEFTIYGGLGEGGSLWHIPIQPLLTSTVGQRDTVSLDRLLRPGLVVGLVTTYYTKPTFGWSGEVGYFGIESEQRCTGPATWGDGPTGENAQACTSAQGQHVTTYVVGLMLGATLRPWPDGQVQPFLRATGGPGLLGNSSYIETTGRFFDSASCQFGCESLLLPDPDKASLTWVASLAGGLSIALAPGYRLRLEGRDVITSLPVASGPRDPAVSPSNPPTGRLVRQVPTFLFALDIELEHRHPRRY